MKQESHSFNYIYFSLFFVIVFASTLSLFSFLPPSQSTFFFTLYALGESLLEVFLLLTLTLLIKEYLPPWCAYLFIGSSFLLFLSHIIDIFLIRIVDLNCLECIDFVLDENIDNFLEMIQTTNIPLFIWGLFGLILLCLPLIGIMLFIGTQKLSEKKPIFWQKKPILKTLFSATALLCLFDLSFSSSIDLSSNPLYQKALPWKKTLISHQNPMITTGPIGLPKEENTIFSTIDKMELAPIQKPNIYLFISESLRADYITEENAPNATQFKKENVSLPLSLSNGNGTHLSWFSIFHSNFSYLWSLTQKRGSDKGSPSLYILKKMGYKIHVYSSAQLNYYNMKELLFGKNLYLADSFHSFPHYYPKETFETDAQAIQSLIKDKNMEEEGNLFIIFLDSTHFIIVIGSGKVTS
ncbi:MAG: hypothetical protein WCP39_05345, partial [Chlamydiota bacterium]